MSTPSVILDQERRHNLLLDLGFRRITVDPDGAIWHHLTTPMEIFPHDIQHLRTGADLVRLIHDRAAQTAVASLQKEVRSLFGIRTP